MHLHKPPLHHVPEHLPGAGRFEEEEGERGSSAAVIRSMHGGSSLIRLQEGDGSAPREEGGAAPRMHDGEL